MTVIEVLMEYVAPVAGGAVGAGLALGTPWWAVILCGIGGCFAGQAVMAGILLAVGWLMQYRGRKRATTRSATEEQQTPTGHV